MASRKQKRTPEIVAANAKANNVPVEELEREARIAANPWRADLYRKAAAIMRKTG